MTTATPITHSFHLSEKGHARMAADLPKVARILRHYATVILSAYCRQPQADKLKQDVANFALWTIEISEQLLTTMEAVSRAEYPAAEWLSAYEQEYAAQQNTEEQNGKGLRNEVLLRVLSDSPYWIEQTTPGEVIIQNLACPACGDVNAWTLTSAPSFIKCMADQCGANIRLLDLLPELRGKLKAACGGESASE